MGKRIEHWPVCAAGFWTAMDGTELYFTDSEIVTMANRINELIDYLKPPLKIHHDEIDLSRMPAAGWLVAGAMAHPDNDGRMTLYINADHVPDGIYQLIENKQLRNPSVEIKENFEGREGWTVTAVALLGVELPAVKGLKDPLEFKEKKELLSLYGVDEKHLDSVAIYFASSRGDGKGTRTLVLSSPGEEGPEKKTKENLMEGYTQEQVDKLVAAAVDKAVAASEKKFSEQLDQANQKTVTLEKANKAKEERLSKLQEAQKQQHVAGIKSFCDGLTAKRVAPAVVKGLPGLLGQLDNEKTLKFADGDGKEVEVTTFEQVKSMISSMVKLAEGNTLILPKGEVAATGDVSLGEGAVDLAAAAEADSKALDQREGK